MTIFNHYSEYYNLLYQDKNYSAEAKYVASLIRKHKPTAKTLLNLGCGTGKHDFVFAKQGFTVAGVDMSEQMLARAEAEKRRADISKVSFVKSDIREFANGSKFDAVVSLFHVMSYQNANHDVLAVLETASNHLKNSGIFIFDFWYGPAVLTDKPSVRMKRMENNRLKVSRVAEPEMDYANNLVRVNYDVFIQDKATLKIDEVRETHSMRYFFEPELNAMLEASQFEILDAKEWMTDGKLSSESWNAVYVCRKNEKKGGRQ